MDIARYFLQFTRSVVRQMTFCRIGTKRMLEILERLCAGKASRQHLGGTGTARGAGGRGSLCGLGKTAPNPGADDVALLPMSMRRTSPAVVRRRNARALIKYAINADCTGCNDLLTALSGGRDSDDALRPARD